jgi:hypothetical protein
MNNSFDLQKLKDWWILKRYLKNSSRIRDVDELLNVIRRNKIQLNKINSEGQNIVHIIVLSKKIIDLQNLIQNVKDFNLKIDFTIEDNYHLTPFGYCCISDDIEMLEVLLNNSQIDLLKECNEKKFQKCWSLLEVLTNQTKIMSCLLMLDIDKYELELMVCGHIWVFAALQKNDYTLFCNLITENNLYKIDLNAVDRRNYSILESCCEKIEPSFLIRFIEVTGLIDIRIKYDHLYECAKSDNYWRLITYTGYIPDIILKIVGDNRGLPRYCSLESKINNSMISLKDIQDDEIIFIRKSIHIITKLYSKPKQQQQQQIYKKNVNKGFFYILLKLNNTSLALKIFNSLYYLNLNSKK